MNPECVTISPGLRARPGLAQGVESQRDVVAEEINLATADAQWDYQQDERGRDLLTLHVRDPLGAEAQTRFSPSEVASEQVLRSRLHELLGAALRVNRWRQHLSKLFQEVRPWLDRRQPPAIVEQRMRTLNEEQSGSYEVPVLRIVVPGGSASLEPVGCWVVGADGRADLVGPEGQEVFVLDERRGWFWISNQPTNRLQPLTETLFLQLLDAVLP